MLRMCSVSKKLRSEFQNKYIYLVLRIRRLRTPATKYLDLKSGWHGLGIHYTCMTSTLWMYTVWPCRDTQPSSPCRDMACRVTSLDKIHLRDTSRPYNFGIKLYIVPKLFLFSMSSFYVFPFAANCQLHPLWVGFHNSMGCHLQSIEFWGEKHRVLTKNKCLSHSLPLGRVGVGLLGVAGAAGAGLLCSLVSKYSAFFRNMCKNGRFCDVNGR